MWDKIAWAGDDGFATRLSQDISTALDDKLMRNTRQTYSTSVANIPAKRPKCVYRVWVTSSAYHASSSGTTVRVDISRL